MILQDAVQEVVTRHGLVNRNKIESYSHIFDLTFRVFATLYKKPNKQGISEDYVELKQISDALVRKQQGQSFVGEAYWIDSDSGNDQGYGDLANMANTGDESPSTSQVRILTSITFV